MTQTVLHPVPEPAPGDGFTIGSSCFAAHSAVECSSAPTWCLHTRRGRQHACDKHLRLIALHLERAGFEPVIEGLPAAGLLAPA